jgi:phosphate transport system substrate-binding protein
VALASLLFFWSRPAQTREVVRIGGTGAAVGGLQALAKAYARHHPAETILILPSMGSSGGIRAVIDNRVDLACSARALNPNEQAPGLALIPWATTAFVFATHADTPPESLSLAELEAIYAGQRATWKDGRPVRLVLRPKADTSHAYLSGFTPGMKDALEKAHAIPGVCVGITDQEALLRLEQTPGSFGTTVLGLVVSEGRQVQVLPVGGVHPEDPAYPFCLTLSFVYRPQECSPTARSFLAFTRSKEGRRLLARAGYRPLPLEAHGGEGAHAR